MENKRNVKRANLLWNQKEENFLAANLGLLTIEQIADKLNRSVMAIDKKMNSMGICVRDNQINSVSVNELSLILGVDHKQVGRWIDSKGLPAKEVKKTKNAKLVRRYIEIPHFWEWVKNNRDTVNCAKIEPLILIPEPAWVNEARKEDFYKFKPQRKKWTKDEDRKAWSLFYKSGMTQKEIGQKLGRTEISVQSRIACLREKGYQVPERGLESVINQPIFMI